MAKEDVRALLGNPNAVILDVRQQGDWEKSPSKIAGAVRMDPYEKLGSLLERFPREKILVFYCN